MTGRDTSLLNFMKSAEQLLIPAYQRNYDWKIEHCEKLFNDLLSVHYKKRSAHFFGSVVSVSDPYGNKQDFVIIDGQQRITTVSLILLALSALLKEGRIASDEPIGKAITNRLYNERDLLKLRSNPEDEIAYKALLEPLDGRVITSNVTYNYDYFVERLSTANVTADALYAALDKLIVIDITVHPPEDDAQLIFESLNSTGLALSEGDKIRNYVLMNLSAKEQDRFYRTYWHPIEKKASAKPESGSNDISDFVRDFLTIRLKRIPNISNVYDSFKQLVAQENNADIESIMAEMLLYANQFYKLQTNYDFKHEGLNSVASRLRRLDSAVTRPFLLVVLRDQEENKLNKDQLAEILLTIESYIFRRIICDLPSSSLNKVFLTLYNDVDRISAENDFVDRMKYVLLSKRERSRYPDDVEFAEALRMKNIYNMNRYRPYLFERLENGDSKEYKDVYERLDNGRYSIEHIMPQTLDRGWRAELGENADAIHAEWLHRLANLTLTAYNAKYSNHPFEEKKTMKDGYLQSGIRMNQLIAQEDHWGAEQLERREKKLIAQVLQLWSYPQSSYSPPLAVIDEYTLEDETAIFTNRVLVRYSFRDKLQNVSSWTEMFTNVVKVLHNEDRSIINQLSDTNDMQGLSAYFSHNPFTKATQVPLEQNLYLRTGSSTYQKIATLKHLFPLFNENLDNLVFYLRSENVGDNEE
jgi:uncharacterized protein with ParB-like and HNH nuclease domain